MYRAFRPLSERFLSLAEEVVDILVERVEREVYVWALEGLA